MVPEGSDELSENNELREFELSGSDCTEWSCGGSGIEKPRMISDHKIGELMSPVCRNLGPPIL